MNSVSIFSKDFSRIAKSQKFPKIKRKTVIVTGGYYVCFFVCPHLLVHFTVKLFCDLKCCILEFYYIFIENSRNDRCLVKNMILKKWFLLKMLSFIL